MVLYHAEQTVSKYTMQRERTDPHSCPQCLVGTVVIFPAWRLELLQILQHRIHLFGLGLVPHTMLQLVHGIHSHLTGHLERAVGEKDQCCCKNCLTPKIQEKLFPFWMISIKGWWSCFPRLNKKGLLHSYSYYKQKNNRENMLKWRQKKDVQEFGSNRDEGMKIIPNSSFKKLDNRGIMCKVTVQLVVPHAKPTNLLVLWNHLLIFCWIPSSFLPPCTTHYLIVQILAE